MTTLDPTMQQLVLINTFTVEPSRSEQLLKLLSDATEEVMRHRPGFVSANLHISLDRRHIANYAQWSGMDELQAMMQDPLAQAHMQAAAGMAESFQPIYYQLKEAIEAAPAA